MAQNMLTDDIIGKIVIAIVAALITYLISGRRAIKQNTFELHKEFHSLDFLNSRTKADTLIKDNNIVDIKSLQKNSEFEHLSRVLHFFCNLQSLKKHRLIDTSLTKAFFSHYFKHFNGDFERVFHFENTLEDSEWAHMYNELKDLEKWL